MKALMKSVHSGPVKRGLAIHGIAYALVHIMKSHVGYGRRITKDNLFRKLFKHEYNDNDLGDYVRWMFAKRSMHLLRQRTKCFIASKQVDDEFYFFVVEDDKDAQIYVDRLEACIKKMRFMQTRARKAATDDWAHQEWMLPTYWVKKLETIAKK